MTDLLRKITPRWEKEQVLWASRDGSRLAGERTAEAIAAVETGTGGGKFYVSVRTTKNTFNIDAGPKKDNLSAISIAGEFNEEATTACVLLMGNIFQYDFISRGIFSQLISSRGRGPEATSQGWQSYSDALALLPDHNPTGPEPMNKCDTTSQPEVSSTSLGTQLNYIYSNLQVEDRTVEAVACFENSILFSISFSKLAKQVYELDRFGPTKLTDNAELCIFDNLVSDKPVEKSDFEKPDEDNSLRNLVSEKSRIPKQQNLLAGLDVPTLKNADFLTQADKNREDEFLSSVEGSEMKGKIFNSVGNKTKFVGDPIFEHISELADEIKSIDDAYGIIINKMGVKGLIKKAGQCVGVDIPIELIEMIMGMAWIKNLSCSQILMIVDAVESVSGVDIWGQPSFMATIMKQISKEMQKLPIDEISELTKNAAEVARAGGNPVGSDIGLGYEFALGDYTDVEGRVAVSNMTPKKTSQNIDDAMSVLTNPQDVFAQIECPEFRKKVFLAICEDNKDELIAEIERIANLPRYTDAFAFLSEVVEKALGVSLAAVIGAAEMLKELILNPPNLIPYIPTISIPDLLPTTDIMAAFAEQVAAAITELVTQAIVGMLKDLLKSLAQACDQGRLGDLNIGSVMDQSLQQSVSPQNLNQLKGDIVRNLRDAVSTTIPLPVAARLLEKLLDDVSAVLKPTQIANLLLGVPEKDVTQAINCIIEAKYPEFLPATKSQGDTSALFAAVGELTDKKILLEEVARLTSIVDTRPIECDPLQKILDKEMFLRANSPVQRLAKPLTAAEIDEELGKAKERKAKRFKDLADLLAKDNVLDGVVPPVLCETGVKLDANGQPVLDSAGKVESQRKPGIMPDDPPSFKLMMDQTIDALYDPSYMNFNQDVSNFPQAISVTREKEKELKHEIDYVDVDGNTQKMVNPELKQLYAAGVKIDGFDGVDVDDGDDIFVAKVPDLLVAPMLKSYLQNLENDPNLFGGFPSMSGGGTMKLTLPYWLGTDNVGSNTLANMRLLADPIYGDTEINALTNVMTTVKGSQGHYEINYTSYPSQMENKEVFRFEVFLVPNPQASRVPIFDYSGNSVNVAPRVPEGREAFLGSNPSLPFAPNLDFDKILRDRWANAGGSTLADGFFIPDHTEIFNDVLSMISNQCAKSPFFDGEILSLVQFAPPPKPGCRDYHLLDLENIKNKIKEDYNENKCSENSMPQADGMGSDRMGPVEEAAIDGAVQTIIRLYVIELSIRAIFVLSEFSSGTNDLPAEIDSLTKSYFTKRIIDDIQKQDLTYSIAFQRQAILYHNKVAGTTATWAQTFDTATAIEDLVGAQYAPVLQTITKILGNSTPVGIENVLAKNWLPLFDVPGNLTDGNRFGVMGPSFAEAAWQEPGVMQSLTAVSNLSLTLPDFTNDTIAECLTKLAALKNIVDPPNAVNPVFDVPTAEMLANPGSTWTYKNRVLFQIDILEQNLQRLNEFAASWPLSPLGESIVEEDVWKRPIWYPYNSSIANGGIRDAPGKAFINASSTGAISTTNLYWNWMCRINDPGLSTLREVPFFHLWEGTRSQAQNRRITTSAGELMGSSPETRRFEQYWNRKDSSSSRCAAVNVTVPVQELLNRWKAEIDYYKTFVVIDSSLGGPITTLAQGFDSMGWKSANTTTGMPPNWVGPKVSMLNLDEYYNTAMAAYANYGTTHFYEGDMWLAYDVWSANDQTLAGASKLTNPAQLLVGDDRFFAPYVGMENTRRLNFLTQQQRLREFIGIYNRSMSEDYKRKVADANAWHLGNMQAVIDVHLKPTLINLMNNFIGEVAGHGGRPSPTPQEFLEAQGEFGNLQKFQASDGGATFNLENGNLILEKYLKLDGIQVRNYTEFHDWATNTNQATDPASDHLQSITAGLRLTYVPPLDETVNQWWDSSTQAEPTQAYGPLLNDARVSFANSLLPGRDKAWTYTEKQIKDGKPMKRRITTIPLFEKETNIPFDPTRNMSFLANQVVKPVRNNASTVNTGLLEAIIQDDKYKFLFRYCFPLKRMLFMIMLYNMCYMEFDKDVINLFKTTKGSLKSVFNLLLNAGDYTYQDEQVKKMAGPKGLMAMVENGDDIPGIDLVGLAARTPLLIFKGLVELIDPNIVIAKKIHDGALTANTDIPMPLASLMALPMNIIPPPPFGPGIGPPITPLGLTYLALGADGAMKSAQQKKVDNEKLKNSKQINLSGSFPCT